MLIAPTSLTAGQTLSLSAVVIPSSASAVYAWTGPGLDGPNGFTSTAPAPSIPATTTAHSGTYSLTVTLANSCTATATTSITVIPASTPVLARILRVRNIWKGLRPELTERQ